MLKVYAAVSRLLCIRFVRSIGYSGRQPVAVAGVIALLVLACDLAVAEFLRTRVQALAGALGPGWTPAVVGAAVELTFLAAGPPLVLAESLRQQNSRIRPMLLALPLRNREASLAIRLPSLAVVALMLVVVFVTATIAISAVVPDLVWSAGTAATTAAAGAGAAALPVLAVRLAMRQPRWARVRLPCTLLLLLGLTVAEFWALGQLLVTQQLSLEGRILLAPWIVQQVMTTGYIPWHLAVACLAIGVAAFVLLAASAVETSRADYGSGLWRWNHRWPLPVMSLELTRLLRSGDVIANAVGSAILIWLLCLVQARLPVQARAEVSGGLLSAVGILAAVPALMIRAQSKSQRPLQLLLGLSVRRWAWSLLGASALITIVLASIGGLTLGILQLPLRELAAVGIPYVVVAYGMASIIGWAMPAGPDNPVGQMVNSATSLISCGLVDALAAQIFSPGSIPWVIILMALGCCGILFASAIEEWREATRWGTI
jgi:hypothetical protein